MRGVGAAGVLLLVLLLLLLHLSVVLPSSLLKEVVQMQNRNQGREKQERSYFFFQRLPLRFFFLFLAIFQLIFASYGNHFVSYGFFCHFFLFVLGFFIARRVRHETFLASVLAISFARHLDLSSWYPFVRLSWHECGSQKGCLFKLVFVYLCHFGEAVAEDRDVVYLQSSFAPGAWREGIRDTEALYESE